MSEKLSQILNASNELNSFSKLPSFKPVVLKNEVNNNTTNTTQNELPTNAEVKEEYLDFFQEQIKRII